MVGRLLERGADHRINSRILETHRRPRPRNQDRALWRIGTKSRAPRRHGTGWIVTDMAGMSAPVCDNTLRNIVSPAHSGRSGGLTGGSRNSVPIVPAGTCCSRFPLQGEQSCDDSKHTGAAASGERGSGHSYHRTMFRSHIPAQPAPSTPADPHRHRLQYVGVRRVGM